MKKSVTAIGEILWDIFPEGKKAGGSSMNVALHLHKQKINSRFISAIGKDASGQSLLDFLNNFQYPANLIQTNDLPTGTVTVNLDAKQQATYTINEPVAWDALELTEAAIRAVKEADAFVYCSLTCRNEKSRHTVLNLLKHAQLKIFDINLRPPFYTPETLHQLLTAADILKINEEELVYLKENFAFTGNTEEELLKQVAQQFNIGVICLTLGEKGAHVLSDNQLYQHNGYPVKVADTVGAGDAFLATFTASYLNGYPLPEVLDRACKLGAFVASQAGANPDYDEKIFE